MSTIVHNETYSWSSTVAILCFQPTHFVILQLSEGTQSSLFISTAAEFFGSQEST